MRSKKWCAFLLVLLAVCISTTPDTATSENTYDPLRRFSQVLDMVENYYVKESERGDLIDGAIRGMLQELDPHSMFMDKEEYDDLQVSTSGEFSGIGIEISLKEGRLVVVSPIEDTPAYEAGLQSEDLILEIEGESTQDISIMDAVKKIRGPKGSEVELTILHKNDDTPITVSIVRDTIPLISVKSETLEPGYAYLRLTRFNEKSTLEMLEALAEQREKGPLKGLILDLRNNPGGLLDQAVKISDLFLDDGMIVYIQGRSEKSRKDFFAANQPTDVTAPLVVLTNAGSASASEIVAGCLQDHKRALLLGEPTFGKGSVQTIIPLPDGAGVKLTTALYYTPSGRSIQAQGIEPDLLIPFEPPAPEAEDDIALRHVMREKDLSGHLENANGEGDEHENNGNKKVRMMLARDNQLRLALQMVKQLPKLRDIQ